MTVNRPATFANIRRKFGKLRQSQVDAFNLFFDEWDGSDKRELAYILATVWHETAKTMQPIEEFGKGAGKPYGEPVGGIAYCGRGHVQITWLTNYKKLSEANSRGWDFVSKPELLLENEPSIWATFYGMRTGIFTGKKLRDYFNAEKTDALNARRIINGKDKAFLIKGYYANFYNAIV